VWKGQVQQRSPAGTVTFHQNTMCGSPARAMGWSDPGFIHTSFLKELWPNVVKFIWWYSFVSSIDMYTRF
uniref:Uncharacterized protein n=1 Tax=Solanum lycopersicum TaxID=4081 RepID=A0A3Q7FZ52_SOLLC